MKIVTVIGARPQFIKAAALSSRIKTYEGIEEIIVHTGQHFDTNMSDVFFNELGIPKPKYNLGINSLTHGAMTGRMLESIERILLDEKPEWLLVYGDTNSTLAGALAAQKLGVKIAHVEAGLRSYNNAMPEEINRVLTDRLSDILFCPTENSVNNLRKEGIFSDIKKVVVSGDIMKESMVLFSSFSKKPNDSIPDKYVLATLHRQENTDNLNRLNSIIKALNLISKDLPVLLPMHPRTKNILVNPLVEPLSDRITIIPPASYLEMLWLINNSKIIITDSGGLQKEAYFAQKFCITTRDETEWIELVDNKINFIASAETVSIVSLFKSLVDKNFNAPNQIFGTGNVSEIILNTLFNYTP